MAAALLAATPSDLVGRLIRDFVVDEPTGGFPLLATGRLDGIEAPRRLRRLDGTVVDAYVWAHVLGEQRPARYGAVDGDHGGQEVDNGGAERSRRGPQGHRHRRPGMAHRPHQCGGGSAARLPGRRSGRGHPAVRRPSERPPRAPRRALPCARHRSRVSDPSSCSHEGQPVAVVPRPPLRVGPFPAVRLHAAPVGGSTRAGDRPHPRSSRCAWRASRTRPGPPGSPSTPGPPRCSPTCRSSPPSPAVSGRSWALSPRAPASRRSR